MRLSTGSTLLPDDVEAILIHVSNNRLYPNFTMRQAVEDAITMLEDEAQEMHAQDVIGIQISHVWDPAHNTYVVTAYGTAILPL